MRRRFLFLLGASFIFLWGCMSSPVKRYFQIYLPGEGREAPAKIERVLLVKTVDVDKVYNDYRIVYRTSPYEVNYYPYKFWVKKPGELFRDSLTRYLTSINAFSRVINTFSQGEPDFLMKAKIRVIEEYDVGKVWFARLAMAIEISGFKTGKLILFHEFDRRGLLPRKNVDQIPLVISRVLEEEMDLILRNLKAKTE